MAKKHAIRPPWTLPFADFIKKCQRCDDCINACPQQIIVKGDAQYPEVDFTQGGCIFCGECAASCKENAFFTDNRTLQSAWSLEVKVSTSCLSLNKIMCRSCGDQCEERAIRFHIKVGGISMPLINKNKCTACGACQFICPNQSIDIINQEST